MQSVTTEQALKNAVASAKMEGLNPTEQDLKLIKDFVGNKISHEEFVNSVLADLKRA